MDKLYDSETGCCKRFDPAPWDKKTKILKNKMFLKDTVRSFFYMPLNFGKIMVKNVEKIQKAGALVKTPFMLSDCSSPWRTDLYIEVSKKVPDAEIVKMSGTFLTKVYEGSYNKMGAWTRDMQEYVKTKHKKMKKMYFFYTTCPACAKVYGKNYTVILAQI